MGPRGCLGIVDHSLLGPIEAFFVSQRSRLLANTLLHIRLADATVGLLWLPLQPGRLVQVTALLPSPGIVLRLPQVAPFHPRLFCIETHFPVLSVVGAPALLRSSARSCQPGWWRPTVKGSGWTGGTQVSLVPLPPAASYLRRSS